MTTFRSNREIDEAKQRASLKKMRTLSTLLLVAMAVVFAISRYFEKRYPIFEIARAFSEAAMVGALADWFAVVALFRRPLNLPIPHTAIIQQNKDRFGKNLATFIKNNFLAREALEQKLETLDFTGWISGALTDPEKAKAISSRLAKEFQSLVGQFDDKDLKHFSVDLVLKNLGKIKIVPLIREILAMLVRENKHQELLTEVLTLTGKAIKNNRDEIKQKARVAQSWWIPDFVDDMIFNKMVGKAEETLLSVQENMDHEIRKRLDDAVRDFIHNLEQSSDLSKRIDSIGGDFFKNPSVSRYFEGVWADMRTKIMNDMGDPSSGLRTHIEKALILLGRSLMDKPSVKEGLNRWIHTSLVNLAEEYADAIISIVSDTVKQWDPIKTSRTIELYVGKDLQWIRINGTVVGGLVGVLIYIISLLFG
jgi:uncharacterized membrane-anchored protein YjiN (DUF445 family)